MTLLIIPTIDNQQLDASIYHVITAAKKLAHQITVLLIGYEIAQLANELRHHPAIYEIIIIDDPCYAQKTAEVFCEPIVALAAEYQHILFAHDTFAKNLSPRVAALLN